MNNTLLWILVAVGAALVGVLFFLMSASPPASGPAPETLIPDAIEGFIVVTKEARIEPAFPGEAYSSHAFYTPAPNGPWSGKIERLGITIFKFKDPTKISEARGSAPARIARVRRSRSIWAGARQSLLLSPMGWGSSGKRALC
jgi:hypothetical protein